jgi:predicted sulfurtransferase
MLVKHKREIIRMDRPAIRPAAGRAPAVDPVTLRRWLESGRDDDGREVVLLDTRNAFEVDHGTFAGALDWRLEKFTEFPDAAAAHRDELVGKTVGSRVLMVVPPADGYGAAGSPPKISGTDTLVFVVDILGVQHAEAAAQ